jgi:hypothetical protein
MTGPQYRVRLLRKPVMLYNGRDFERAALVLDTTREDRVLERRDWDGWRSVISVEGAL